MITKFDKTLLEFLEKNKVMIFLICISILALVVRYMLLGYISGDYEWFLRDWFDTLKANGGISALKEPLGDYNIPYVTILSILTYLPFSSLVSIKLVSIFFDFIGAIFAALIVHKLLSNSENRNLLAVITYAVILFIPTAILNSSAWAQCDFIYTSFLLISFYYLIDRKYFLTFICYGIAFSFKLQAIFVLPILVIIYLVRKEFSILYFCLIPITNIVLCLPAIMLGHPISHIFNVYFNQTQTYADLTRNFANIYTLLPNQYYWLKGPGIIFTLFIVGIFAYLIWSIKKRLTNEEILTYILWLIMIITFFLPGMHERYLFAADIFSIIYFMVIKKNIYVPITVNLVSFLCYQPFLFDGYLVDLKIIAILYFIVICVYTTHLFKDLYLDTLKIK